MHLNNLNAPVLNVLTCVWCKTEIPYLLHGVIEVDTEVNICGIVQDKKLQTVNTNYYINYQLDTPIIIYS